MRVRLRGEIILFLSNNTKYTSAGYTYTVYCTPRLIHLHVSLTLVRLTCVSITLVRLIQLHVCT